MAKQKSVSTPKDVTGDKNPNWKGGITINRKEYDDNYRLRNPEIFKASQIRYKNSLKGRITRRRGHLRKNFGITLEEYDKFLAEQKNRCAICDIHQSKLNKSFDVDHNHDTGRIRGLLCNRCNQALGLFEENPMRLIRATNYLRKYDE